MGNCGLSERIVNKEWISSSAAVFSPVDLCDLEPKESPFLGFFPVDTSKGGDEPSVKQAGDISRPTAPRLGEGRWKQTDSHVAPNGRESTSLCQTGDKHFMWINLFIKQCFPAKPFRTKICSKTGPPLRVFIKVSPFLVVGWFFS